ncbi:MAG: hypothetical protein KBT00_06380 [Bacteroidales bacterium]|nr:hypothetical protein [Candidatus Cacconaster merdequi]
MRRILLILICVALCYDADAQFIKDRLGVGNSLSTVAGPPGAMTENAAPNDSTEVPIDSAQGFSFVKMVRGYARKDTLQPGYMLLGTALVPGAGQFYNRQYWKIPFTYAGIGSGLFCGIWGNKQYAKTGEKKYSTLSLLGYIGAGAVYWGQMMDAVVNYSTPLPRPVPAKSTIYSLLLPGLGQANNGDYWKIPIWYGGLMTCAYFYHTNNIQYQRFRYLYEMSTYSSETGYTGSITASQAEWYRDTYRRYRDYSILAAILVYALQVIDANVFAYMADFNVDNNIASIDVRPAVIPPLLPELQQTGSQQVASVGFNFQLNF